MMLTMADIKNANVRDSGKGEGKKKGKGERAEGSERGREEEKGGGGGAAGRASMTLHGPPGVSEFYRATRHFMNRSDFPVAFEEVEVCVLVLWLSFCTFHSLMVCCLRMPLPSPLPLSLSALFVLVQRFLCYPFLPRLRTYYTKPCIFPQRVSKYARHRWQL